MAINNLKKFIMTPPKDTADPKKNEDKTKLEENSSLFQSPQDGSKLFGATTRDQSNKNTDNNMEIEEIKQGAPKEVNSKDITHSTQLFTNESNNQVLSSHTSTTTKRYEFYNKTYTKPNNAKKLKSIKETLHSYGNRLQNFLYRTLHLGFPGTNKSRSQRVSEDAINLCTKSRDFIFLAEDTKSGGWLGENAATKLNDIIAGDVNHEGNAGQHVLDRVKNEHGEDVAIINKNNEGEPIEMKEQYFLHQGVKGMLILEINRTFGNADSNTGTSYKLFMFEKNDNNVYPITDETVWIKN